MLTLTKWIMAPALAIGMCCAGDLPTAQAGHGCYGYGGGYYGGYPGIYSSGYGVRVGGIGISISHGRYGAYRSHSLHRSYFGGGYYPGASRFDYYPSTIRRHGPHLHVTPRRHDFRRSGYYHRH